ncbi:MAG: alpha/beta fold hydrolase [Rubrobacter sp.]|nr:alpha/beta fold hydrolase [Rubrobacter sp.]
MPVFITHDASIDYDVHGNGPPLLLIGGLGFGRWGWFKQIPVLSRHFRTITFDIRGEQNLTQGVANLSAEAEALLDHLGVKKSHVLGTSLGGFVAQQLALEQPELIDRLVLVCTSHGGKSPEPLSPQALGRMIGWGSLSPEKAVRRGLETATSEAYRAGHPEEFEQVVRWRLADSPSLSNYLQQAMAGARFDFSRDVGNITSPTLVVHGAKDRYVPVTNAAVLAKAIPNAKLRVLKEAGHLVFIEQAKEVNRQIVSFLKPRKPTRRQQPRKLSARQKLVSFFKPRKRQKLKKSLVKKTKQLIRWAKETSKGIVSFIKPRKQPEKWSSQRSSTKAKTKKLQKIHKARTARKPRKAKGDSAIWKPKVWLRDSRQSMLTWAKKLRRWLSS